jgi:hypothetical protein
MKFQIGDNVRSKFSGDSGVVCTTAFFSGEMEFYWVNFPQFDSTIRFEANDMEKINE